jgi:hypothetical protein
LILIKFAIKVYRVGSVPNKLFKKISNNHVEKKDTSILMTSRCDDNPA